MKKTLALLLTIGLITTAFVSCNLDGNSGIFREITLSKTPLSIRYKQLLGNDATYLYFRTLEGVERVTTAKVNTIVAASKNEHIIQMAAYLKAPDNKVFYFTNNDAERAANQIRFVDTTNINATAGTITVTTAEAPSIVSDLSVKGLYANSMILVTGKNGASAKVFDLLEYSSAAPINFKTPVASFTTVPAGYDLDSVIQQTAREQDATAPMIVSFISADGKNREHYLVEPSGPTPTSLGTENSKIANFLYKATNNLYVLTTDGKIYHVNGTTWTSIATSSKTYATNAFALAVDDSTNYHLITKPSVKNASLHVFTFPNTLPNTAIGAGVDVKSGYAQELALATTVSSQVKSTVGTTSTDLLIATDENGMYDISIKHADANKDITTNGTSSVGEGYTFP